MSELKPASTGDDPRTGYMLSNFTERQQMKMIKEGRDPHREFEEAQAKVYFDSHAKYRVNIFINCQQIARSNNDYERNNNDNQNFTHIVTSYFMYMLI